MTLAAAAWGEDAKSYSGKDFRLMLETLGGHDGIAAIGGVTHGMKVAAQGSPNATVSVAAGTALAVATEAGKFGTYGAWNDAALNSGSFAATSGNGRWDYLVLRVTSGVPALEIVQGTAAASPAAPTITGNNVLPLALVKLPPSTTNITNAMITDARVFIGRWAQAWGIQGAPALITSNSSGITTLADVSPALTVSLPSTWPANRRVLITIHTAFRAVGAASQANALIREGSTTLATATVILPANTQASTVIVHAHAVPTAGAHTYKFSASANTLVDVPGSSIQNSIMTVTDLGPSANPD